MLNMYFAESKSQGSPNKNQATYSKDGKPAYSTESTESPYFGSSVHYGGRDFYGSAPSKHATDSSKSVSACKRKIDN